MAAHNPGQKNSYAPRPAAFAHVVGWGMALPENVMTNADISAFVETSDEWIFARTGIRERRIANEQESTATLAYKVRSRPWKSLTSCRWTWT